MKSTKAICLLLALGLAPFANAADLTDAQMQKIKTKLNDSLSIDVASMQESPLPGLVQAITDRGVVYITEDGTKLFHGNIYDLDKGMKNLTEAALAGPRLEMLEQFADQMLVFPAKNEQHVITVFTDISCGYCRKLHTEMQDYNDAGITVRYLAFPRQGVPSKNADDMRSIWCATDPNKAMDSAQNGQSVALAKCDADIAGQYKMGASLGVTGTPAIVLADGSMIPGYQPASDLKRILEVRAQ
ncbi:bifunctional protein-disulfide isomerase/oxidoreductase DsbC [Shewanella sp. NIFS-20-20]|uniref:bifunctional protein-disulfide isomerase/oxidoreductase DsbC n=1 Tax=Shewanella sp. NIFS-20-20 TaxID=2853806 RepID=UPI001C45DC1D|nr:bifunctional protein-disulfide isomerase/oxidoreductase DsbC [Shewanella sp. NIFS-20-20]MBV7317243.1 bifunctional protein-disulfide isomerase/oxidoreductase DsbC [Shewanella sp. NIFS-20-20]